MKSKHTLLYFVTGGLIVVAAAMSWICFKVSTNKQFSDLNYQIRSDNAEITKYNNMNKKMTVDKVLNDIAKENVNVSTALNSATDNIKEAINLAYSHTKTQADSEQNAKKLPKLVGQSMADKLLDVSRPTPDQNGGSRAVISKAENVVVTFGKYDYQTTVIPVYVVVDYDIPGNLKGTDIYVLSYNLKSKKLDLQGRYTK